MLGRADISNFLEIQSFSICYWQGWLHIAADGTKRGLLTGVGVEGASLI
jgi:hypothetical protein